MSAKRANRRQRQIDMDLKELASVSDAAGHWYYASKLAAVSKLIDELPGSRPRSLLDVGSGSGFFARSLLEQSGITDATCVDPGYATDLDEQVAGKPLLLRRSLGQSSADMVLMMDVLEHVPDDAALVAEYVAKVASGTRFLVTVPAFNWLWSQHDEFLGHYRRYQITSLEAALAGGGVQVTGSCYLFGAVFPMAVASRLASRLRPKNGAPQSQMGTLPAPLNAALAAACKLGRDCVSHNKVAGLTVAAWGIKR